MIAGLVIVFTGLAVLNTALFARAASRKPAFWLLVALTLTKIAIISQDFRLAAVQHYIALWITAIFLWVPFKRQVLPGLVVSFYVWAGLLKLNPEWLSGSALYGRRPFGMPSAMIPAACLYVVVLELVIVFGVLSRRRSLFWFSFLQLIAFHIASFWVVGFFFPMIMFAALAVLPLTAVTKGDLFKPASRLAVASVLVLVSALQLVPRALSHDPSITGEGRVFALNMFDAPLTCEGRIFIDGAPGETGDREVRRLGAAFLHPRIQCDPIVYYEAARGLCRRLANRADPRDFDLLLETRKGKREPQVVVNVPAFCESSTAYSFFRHNSWIMDGPPAGALAGVGNVGR